MPRPEYIARLHGALYDFRTCDSSQRPEMLRRYRLVLAAATQPAPKQCWSALRWDVSFGIDHDIMTAAKVFRNGRSQAVRLPKEFRVSTDEVFLKKTSEGFLVIERDPWEIFEEGCRELSEDFLAERVQPPLETRDWSK